MSKAARRAMNDRMKEHAAEKGVTVNPAPKAKAYRETSLRHAQGKRRKVVRPD